MKKTFFSALAVCLLLSAGPAQAATPVLAWHRFQNSHHFSVFHRFHHSQRLFPVRRFRHFQRFHGWWGWGSGWGWYYPPYYGYGGYYRPYGYDYPSAEWARIDTDVDPEEARVYLDGRYIGIADDFDGWPDRLYLKPGRYRLEFRLEGYEPLVVEVDARPGMKLDVKDKMRKIPGAKQYGSYGTPKPEGGVRRYWAKRKDVAESVTDEDEISGYSPRRGGEDAEVESGSAESRSEGSRDSWRDKPGREVRSQETKSPTELRAAKPRLRLHVEPPDAAVYVDDRFVGTAEEVNSLERGVSVSPGKHAVTVSRPGFKEKTIDVEVREGQGEKLEVSLSR